MGYEIWVCVDCGGMGGRFSWACKDCGKEGARYMRYQKIRIRRYGRYRFLDVRRVNLK